MEILILIVVSYFFPSMLACIRHHRNAFAIIVTNVFFGWTGIVWIFALIWACTDNVAPIVKRRWI